MAYIIEISIFIAIAAYLFYRWATANFGTFTERNIKHDKPIVLLGNILTVLTGKESTYSFLINQYDKFKAEKIYGFYGMREPVFMITDPDLIKKVAIKDFEYFPNRRNNNVIKHEEFIGSMLSMLPDKKWRNMRATLSPVFTGSKMRQIYQLINECGSEAVKYLRDEIKTDETELDFKEFFTRYTVDVIASAAFGLKVNSFKEKENAFYTMGRKVMKFEGIVLVKMFILTVIPQITKIFKIKILNVEAMNYLKGIVLDTINFRKKNKVIRQDMIHLLIEAQKKGLNDLLDEEGHTRNWTETEIIAQCLQFFFAGFETVANMLCFTAYELMKNPEIQEKLYDEIAAKNNELNGAQLSYDYLKDMKYLDMVISESLRKWPPSLLIDRLCSRPYTLTDDNGQIVAQFKTGDHISYSIIGNHYDQENFPDPYEFNPERFSEENKHNIKPLTYVPFGVGPRNCIANRFALMEGKAMLYHLLLEFKFVPGAKSTPDLLEAFKGVTLKPKQFFWLKLIPRRGQDATNLRP